MKSNGIIYIFWTFLSIQQFTFSLGKAYPNLVSSTNQYFESLCYNETNNERFVESDSRRSSFFLELHSNAMMRKKFCERNFTTSESHGFIIRLIIAKNKLFSVTSSSGSSNSNSNINSNSNLNTHHNININSNSNTMLSSQRNHGKTMPFKNTGGNNKYHGTINYQSKNQLNASKSCPLTIYTYNNHDYHDEQILWQIDPCELEGDENNFGNENNWPVKFFEGHIKIRWEHNHNSIYSKLMITALGKGDACSNLNKFPCLILSGSPLFCISKDLICDNIRHCPNGNLYDDDEDKKMCDELNLRPALFPPSTTVIFDNEWEQQLMLWMQHAFGEFSPSFSSSSSSSSSNGLPSEFSLFGDDIPEKEYHDGRPISGIIHHNDNGPFQENENGYDINNDDDDIDKHNKKSTATVTTSSSTTTTTQSKKNTAKNSLTGDLSKYGPWGYLMLGMLLCGGALLICGLWECCCRNNKNESHITASTLVGNTTSLAGGTETSIQSSSRNNHQNITPPNYDELDPPPAYSVLFPNQKATTATSTTTVIESSQQQQQRPQLPPPPSPTLEPSPPPPFSNGITDGNTMVTVPVVVVVTGGARTNNSNNNNNRNNNITSDLTPASSS